MSLQGTLDTFSLPDVLRFLAASTKTGRLMVDGPRGVGEVWLDEGGVVAAESDSADAPVDVVFELLREPDGAFTFEAELTRSDAGDPLGVDDLLGQAEARLAEWRDIEAVVPSLRCSVDLADDIPGGAVRIESDQWKVLVAAAHEGTVAGVGTRLGLGEFDVSRAVKELVERGLISIDVGDASSPAEKPAPSATSAARSRPKTKAKATASRSAADPDDDEAATAEAAPTEAEAALPAGLEGVDPDVARQLAEMGPEATRAMAEAARATTDEERERALAGMADDDPVNRGLLLKFLSSVRT